MNISDESKAAFWSKVDATDLKSCWNWTGAKKKKGYGNVRIDGRYMLAHRVAWILCNFDPPDGYVVMHICDNPSCCNPSHLVLGTSQANNCDRILKNRSKPPTNPAMGERNTNSKLTNADVVSIRQQYPTKNQYQLAEEFGVTQSAIGAIVRRQTWRHLP